MINENLQARLTAYKARAEKINSGESRCIGTISAAPLTWREVRKEYPLDKLRPAALKKPAWYGRALHAAKDILYLDQFEDMPGYIREPKDAHKCTRLRYTGWYTNNFQDAILQGVVIPLRDPQKINTENGSHIFYLAGTKHSDWDGVTVYTGELFECESDAAYRADHYAEEDAETCREDDQKYRAEEKISELKAEYHELNKEALEVIKDARNASGIFPASICLAPFNFLVFIFL